MHKLIYASRATRPIERGELAAILATSRDNNTPAGVTGLLLYSDRSFLQVLEGDADAVHETFARIQGDDRHTDVRLLVDGPADGRLFPDWSMGFGHLDEQELRDTVPGYRAPTRHPLVSPDVVLDGDVAETILLHHGRGPGRTVDA